MMQESTRLSILPRPAWSSPHPSSNGDGETMKTIGGCNKSSRGQVNNTLTNGHTDPYNFDCLMSSSSSDNSKRVNKETKPKSNIQSWLSPHRPKSTNSTSRTPSSPIVSSSGHVQVSGFDMTKLYPELSAKLGLIKSPESNNSNKSHSSPVRNGFTTKDSNISNISKKTEINNSESKIRVLSSSQSIISIKNQSNPKLGNNVGNLVSKLGSSKPSRSRNKTSDKTKRSTSVSKTSQHTDWKKSRDITTQELEKSDANRKLEDRINHINLPTASTSTPGRNLSHVACTYPSGDPKTITVNTKKALSPINNSKLPPDILRVHSLYQDYYAYKSDLFPLGMNGSDSECSENEDDNWWSPNVSDFSDSRHQTKDISKYRKQLLSTYFRVCSQETAVQQRHELSKALIKAARSNPNLTSSSVSHFNPESDDTRYSNKYNRYRSSLLIPRRCVYNSETVACGKHALPGTRHCLQHITYNVDQQLFSQCTARHSDNTFCRVPVCDISHRQPLCHHHAAAHRNEIKEKPSPDAILNKAKRSRKKNKMPTLSRYGKRSKRRRSSASVSSSIVPSTKVRPPMGSQTTSLSSPISASPATSPNFSTASCSESVVGVEESELEEEMEGLVGGFGIEAATRLLDSSDLQEVFSKIPEHEINQLFDGPGTKTEEGGEESSTKENICVGSDGESQPQESNNPTCDKLDIKLDHNTNLLDLNSNSSNQSNTITLDDTALSELVASNVPIDSIISSTFNQQDLNTISQVLSNIVHDESLSLGNFQLPISGYSEVISTDAMPLGDGSNNSNTIGTDCLVETCSTQHNAFAPQHCGVKLEAPSHTLSSLQ